MRLAKMRSALNVAENSLSGDQSIATSRATSQAPSTSSSTRLCSVRLPDQMPSMPATLTTWPGDDAKCEIMPARLSLPRSVSVSTATAPTVSASVT